MRVVKIVADKEENKKKEEKILTGEIDAVGAAPKFAMFLVCVMVLFLAVRFCAGAKREYSENENRTLAQMPEFTPESLKGGDYTSGLEKYVSDQFPMRDGFLAVMTAAERMTGRKEINDVYLAGHGFLIKAYDEPQSTERIISQFRKLAENVSDTGVRVRLMLVPTSVTICRGELPEFAPDRIAQLKEAETGIIPSGGGSGEKTTQKAVIAYIYDRVDDVMETVNAADALEQESYRTEAHSILRPGNVTEQSGNAPEPGRAWELYYRTDHHWTAYGAYTGYRTYCEAAGLAAKPLEEYEKEVVSVSFRGTTYSRLNDPFCGFDSILAYTDPAQKLTVVYEDTGEVSDSLFNPEYLSQRDQYSFFLNNIHPLVTITNEAAPEGALALVKDSYANSMLPFLVSNYRTIYVFDTRYYRGSPSAFIKEHGDITDVLVLYNMGTIDTDTGIGGIF